MNDALKLCALPRYRIVESERRDYKIVDLQAAIWTDLKTRPVKHAEICPFDAFSTVSYPGPGAWQPTSLGLLKKRASFGKGERGSMIPDALRTRVFECSHF
ncbi:MAG: hypothetical protein D6690_14090 [Nitrospirae bacterium]|nr:MAG: hypothetical protein D6690_14090 [Nitrospirota bacterium]